MERGPRGGLKDGIPDFGKVIDVKDAQAIRADVTTKEQLLYGEEQQ